MINKTGRRVHGIILVSLVVSLILMVNSVSAVSFFDILKDGGSITGSVVSDFFNNIRDIFSFNDASTSTVSVVNSATRTLPSTYTPGTPVDVSITVNALSSVVAYGLEDSPPAGWTVTAGQITCSPSYGTNCGGVWDSVKKKVKWAAASDAE